MKKIIFSHFFLAICVLFFSDPVFAQDAKTRFEGTAPREDFSAKENLRQSFVCPEGNPPQKGLVVAYEGAGRVSLFDEEGIFVEDLATDMAGPSGLAVSGPYLIVTNDNGEVVRFDLRTRTREILVDGLGNPNGVAGVRSGADPKIFVTDAATGKLYQCSSLKLGSCKEIDVTFREPLDVPQGIAFDGRFLYVGDFRNLYKIDLSQENKAAEPAFPEGTFIGSQGGYTYSETLGKVIAPQYDNSFWIVDPKDAKRFSMSQGNLQLRGAATKPGHSDEVFVGNYQDGSVFVCRLDLTQSESLQSCRYFIEDYAEGMGTTGLAWVELCAAEGTTGQRTQPKVMEEELDATGYEDQLKDFGEGSYVPPRSRPSDEETDAPGYKDKLEDPEEKLDIPMTEEDKIFFEAEVEETEAEETEEVEEADSKEDTLEIAPVVDSASVSPEPEGLFSEDPPAGWWSLTGGGSCESNLDPRARPTRTGIVFSLFVFTYLLIVLRQRKRLV